MTKIVNGIDGSHLQSYVERVEKLEADKKATISILERVQKEGSREVSRKVEYYNLDAIIAVGYRVNSKRAKNNSNSKIRTEIKRNFIFFKERAFRISYNS